MQIYRIQGPDGKIHEMEGPSGASDEQVMLAFSQQYQPEKVPTAPSTLKDIAVAGGLGAVGATKAVTDIFGADNPVSETLGGASKSLEGMYTPARKKELEYYRKQQEEAAKAGKPLDEMLSVAREIKASPLQSGVQAVTSFVPNLLSLFIPVVGEARGAALARTVYNIAIGAAEGAGAVKGSIYDTVKQELENSGVSPQEAAARAAKAQEYFGENAGQIATGAGIGAVAGKYGAEEFLNPAVKGATRKVAGVVSEIGTEAGQAGQEQVAQNIALQRQGFNVPTFQGVAGAATKEGIMGGMGAGVLSGFHGRPSKEAVPDAPPVTDAQVPLLLEGKGVFVPVGLPDGSVAMTREDLAKYREEQFQKQYAPQEVAPTEATTPEVPAAPEAPAAPTEPTSYATAVQESEYLKRQPKTPEVKARLAELEQYKQTFLQDRLNAAQTEISPESQAIREQMEAGEVTPANIVSEIDFKTIGVGPTNKKLREAILGKDLNDPAQAQEVKTVLEDYANNPNRSAKLIAKVEEFLNRPEFNVTPESVAPVAEEVITEPEETPTEAPVVEPADVPAPAEQPVAAVPDVAESVPTEPAVDAVEDITPAAAQEVEDTPAAEATKFITKVSKTRKPRAKKTIAPVEEQTAPVEEPIAPVAEAPVKGPAFKPTTPTAPEIVSEGKIGSAQAINKLVATTGYNRTEAARVVADMEHFSEVDPADLENAIREAPRKVKYKTAKPGAKGSTKAEVDEDVALITDRWVQAPPIEVVQSIADLPKALRDQIARDKVNPQGAFDPDTGTVYLIADNIRNRADAAITIAHEVLGHFGIRSVLGGTYESMMDGLYAGNLQIRKLATKKMAEGLDKHTAVEEVLAELAEKGVANSGLQKLFNAVRQFFRRLGVPMSSVTDVEIRELIAHAREYVIEGGATAEGTAAFKGKALYKTKPLTPEGEAAAALNERMKGISNPDPKAAEKLAKGIIGAVKGQFAEQGISFETFMRQQIADKAAPVKEKIAAKFNNKLVNDSGITRADLVASQAQDSAGFTLHVIDGDGIRINDIGLVETYARKDGPSMKKVFDTLHTLGDRLGSLNLATQLAHNALIANRANEIIKSNVKFRQQADDARAKGNEAAAIRLEKQIVQVRVSQEEIDVGLEAMATYPEIKQVLKEFTEYKNELIDFMVACGRITEATAEDWKKNAGYVPWTRVEETVNLFEADTTGAYKAGVVNLSKLPLLDREGSSKEINNVFENMVGFTQFAIKSGMKARAANQMAEQLDDAVEIKTDDALKVAQKNHPNRVIYTYKKGERIPYLLGSALDMPAFSSVMQPMGLIMKSGKFVGDKLRSAITHMPAFSVSQLGQDTVRAMALSGVKQPFSLPSKVMKNYVNALRGNLSPIDALGVTGVYDGMPEHIMEKVNTKYGLKERNAAKKIWDKLEKFSLAADIAVRAAIYDQTIEETRSAAMPDGDIRLALHRAKEYINFKNEGDNQVLRNLRHVVPFLNAYIQGMDVLVRTMRGKGISLAEKKEAQALFLATGFKIMALTTMYTLLVGDDEEYKGLEDYERDKNFIIPGTGFKIPVAPEIGFLFKVIPERIINATISQGTDRPQDAETFYKGFRDAFLTAFGGPNITPQVIKPLLEVADNYSIFTKNAIVGHEMIGREAEFQSNERTSELAKLFGMVGISPLKADYLIRAYTGTAGGTALDVMDAIFDPNRMSKPINKLPQISTFMYDPTGRGYKSDFYNFRESVMEVVNTVNMFKREGRAEELQNYMTPEKMQLYAMEGITSNINETLSDLRGYRNVIAADKDLSSAEKREKTDEITKQEREVLLAYNIPNLRQLAKPQE